MSRADGYLTIPPLYAAGAGGPRWASRGDAVELDSGDVVALADELAEVLAGAFAAPNTPHFGHLLSAYRRLKAGGDGFDAASAAFHAARRLPGSGRNAGRLVAHLCRGLPPVPDAPGWAEVELALSRLRRDGHRHRPHLAVEPPLSSAEFHPHLKHALAPLSLEVLEHWFRHGAPPAPDGPRLAEPVESLAARLAKALAAESSRLGGAARLVPLLDAALTLPPRKSARRVPQGGYADVSTRGTPDRLLTSQLALDPDEFVRRFAENELLYFEREEPHAPTPAARLLVLDQGVRTWGAVRLALAAAVAALLGKDPKRAGVAALSTTAGPVDLDSATPAELAERLGASDLTADPASALRHALSGPTTGPRDIVLLTHPRALLEASVIEATEERGPDDRLFALTVAADGRAELLEWRPGGPVSLRGFRIDFSPPPEATDDGPPPEVPITGGREWGGEREPVGFPFRPGLVGEVTLIGLDAAGTCVVAVTREGVPQLLTSGDTAPEILPRAMRGKHVLRQVEAVLGVRGGVVLCGRMTLPAPPIGVTVAAPGDALMTATATVPAPVLPQAEARLVAAHYDFAARTIRLHDVGSADGLPKWHAHPDLHCVVARDNAHAWCCAGLDLDSGFVSASPGGNPPEGHRASAALRRGDGEPCGVRVIDRPPTKLGVTEPTFVVRADGSLIALGRRAGNEHWQSFTPTADGKPLFAARISGIERVILANDVLAVRTSDKLYLFRGPSGAAIRSVPLRGNRGQFALSADGRRLGVLDGPHGVSFSDADDAGAALATAHGARLHSDLEVEVSDQQVTIGVGTFVHNFSFATGRLVHDYERRTWKAAPPVGRSGCYDPQRFTRRVAPFGHGLAAAEVWADRLGQVVLADKTGRPLAAFLVRREKVAAWGAGGALWGDAALLGGPSTPDAARRIAAVLVGGG